MWGKRENICKGGVRDNSEIYINYSRQQLLNMIYKLEKKTGLLFHHDLSSEDNYHNRRCCDLK